MKYGSLTLIAFIFLVWTYLLLHKEDQSNFKYFVGCYRGPKTLKNPYIEIKSDKILKFDSNETSVSFMSDNISWALSPGHRLVISDNRLFLSSRGSILLIRAEKNPKLDHISIFDEEYHPIKFEKIKCYK